MPRRTPSVTRRDGARPPCSAQMAAVPSLPDGGEYRVVLVPATAAADAGAFPAGSFVLPAGTTLSSAPLPAPDLGGVDPATGLPSAPGDAYGGLGPLHLGEGGAGLGEGDTEAFAAHALLAPFGAEGADAYYGPLDTAQFAAAAGLLPPLPPPEEQALLPPPPPPLPVVRPRAWPARASALRRRARADAAPRSVPPQAAAEDGLRAGCVARRASGAQAAASCSAHARLKAAARALRCRPPRAAQTKPATCTSRPARRSSPAAAPTPASCAVAAPQTRPRCAAT